MSCTEQLRADLRQCIIDSGESQANVARTLGITPKHLSYLMCGRAVMTVEWAERIAAVCGRQVVISVIRPWDRGAAPGFSARR